MAIVHENSHTFVGAATGFEATHTSITGFTPTVGRKLFLAVASHQDGNILRVNQTGVVWSKVGTAQELGSPGSRVSVWFGDVQGPTVSTTINVTMQSNTESSPIAIHEISGLLSVWPVDSEVVGLTGNSSSSMTGDSGFSLAAEAYVFAALSMEDNAGGSDPGAPSGGFTERAQVDGTTAHRLNTADKILASVSTEKTSLAFTGPFDWASLVCTAMGGADTADIQLIQEKSASVTAANSVAVTLDSALTPSSTLIASISVDDEVVTSVISTNGIWVQDAQSDNGFNANTEVWRARVSGTGITITANLAAATNATLSVQEFSGILGAGAVSPVESVVTASGGGDTGLSSAQTAALVEQGSMVFSAFTQAKSNGEFQNCPGFSRSSFNTSPTVMGATFYQNRTYAGGQYETVCDTYVTGGPQDHTAAIVVYKSASAGVDKGAPLNAFTAERNLGGTVDIVTSGSFATFAEIAAGQFIDGHRYLVLASAHVGGNFTNVGGPSIRLVKSATVYDQSDTVHGLIGGGMQGYNVSRVLTLNSTDNLKIEVALYNGVTCDVKQINLVAIDLDSGNFLENTDWFYNEHAVAKADLDNVFANNVGAAITFVGDGSSDYLVIGNSMVSATATTVDGVYAGIQLWNSTALAEISLSKVRNQSPVNVAETYPRNVMAVLSAPSGSTTIQLRHTGDTTTPPDGWSYENSSITIIRLDKLVSKGFDQDLSLGVVGTSSALAPDANASAPRAAYTFTPDEDQDMLSLAFMEADSAVGAGFGAQAQFPGIDMADRSLWDTEDATLGGSVGGEERVECSDSEATTAFGVSLKRGVALTPATARLYVAGMAATVTLNRVCMVSIGLVTVAAAAQSAPPASGAIPTVDDPLVEKVDGVHLEEALANMLKQFKP